MNNTHQGIVNIYLTTEIHQLEEDGTTNPIPEYKQNYGKSAFYKVEGTSIEECVNRLQQLLDKIGAMLTNEQTRV